MATTGDDCYFFYYSTCSKGSLCPYRHSPEALGNEVTCLNWKQGFCYRPNCAFRHMEISKNRSEIQCYWESQPTGCQKPHCTFKHFKRGTIEGASTTQSSMSLINMLPTITGPVTKAPPMVSVPAIPSVTPIIQPSVQASQEMEEAISMPTVKPVVVTPMDSEDDESVSTMSTDGSPSKRLLVSPVRPSIRPPLPSTKNQPIMRGPVRTFNKVKPASAQDKPHTFGIKTLAEIRREKERERGHDDEDEEELEKGKREEEKMEEEEPAKKMMELEDFLEEEDNLYPSLTRRIISVSSTEDKRPTTKPANRRALIQTNRLGETGVGSLAGTRDENRMKRLGRSLEQGDRERESIRKRIQISNTDFPLEAEFEDEPKKKIMRRVVVGAGAGAGAKKVEADSSVLDSVKIKTVAEIKQEKLAQRLGQRVVGDGGAKDNITVATSSASRRTGLAERMGKVTRAFGSDDEGKKSKDGDADATRKRSLAGRLGSVSRTVKTGEEDAKQDLPASRRAGSLALRLGKPLGDDRASERSGYDRTAAKATVGLATRLGRVVGNERASESSGRDRTAVRATVGLATRLGRAIGVERGSETKEKSSSSSRSGGSIKIKSLEEIKREKLLRRLGKLPGEGDESRSSDGERQASSQEEEEEEDDDDDDDDDDSSEEDSSSEDSSDIDLPEEDTSEEEEDEEEEKEEVEKKKSSGEIRIKTLEEIRLEKQKRLGTHIASKSSQEVERENTSESLKKGVQSAQERRNRKRTEMALYKPPAANRGSKENQSSGPGLWRSVLNVREKEKEKERKSDEERPIKVRRLNLSKSVETANKGTESVLNIIKQKKEGFGEEVPSIKVKSLAEIRAEKRRLGRLAGGDNLQGDQETDPSDPGEERTSSLSPERRKREEKTEEEKRRERRAKIWSRVEGDEDKPQKPVTSGVGKGDEVKTQDQLRRERRARLWNITPAGDAPSQPVIRRPGHVTSSSDASGEIKIKTLAEIRREKQLREQQQQQQQQEQQQQQQNQNRNQAAATSSTNFMQSSLERTNRTPTSVFGNDSLKARMDTKEVSVVKRGDAKQRTDAIQTVSVTGQSDATMKDQRPAREERVGRIRGIRSGMLETGDSVEAVETVVSQEDHLLVTTSATIPATKQSRKPLSRRLGRVVANTSQEIVQVDAQETSSQEQPFMPQSVPPQAAATSSAYKETNIAPLETQGGSRLEGEKVESSFVDDPNISLISLGSEPDTTTVDSTTTEYNAVPQSKPAPKRLASMTDDEDLHRFLEEHDGDDADLDDDHGKLDIATVAHHDDDDLLNELDDFLNS